MGLEDANYDQDLPPIVKLTKLSSFNKRGQKKPISDPKLIPSEYHECVILVSHLEELKIQGKVKLFTHISNETYTKYWSVKAKNKMMGVRPGIPDYLVVTAKELLFIEMKRTKGGVVGKEQKEWLKFLTAIGVQAVVCKGAEEAITFLDANV
jgi:hypothetical protein